MSLRLLLDCADPNTWEELIPTGLFTGITTNPTLLHKANQSCDVANLKVLRKKAESLGCNEIHLQAWGNNSTELTNCGMSLANLTTSKIRIHVKLPITKAGSEVAKKLISEKVPITFTACYSTKQIFIAAALGATHIAPYLGRINDLGRDGTAEILEMNRILTGIESSCNILTASIRSQKELIDLASNGLNTFTISPSISRDLFNVPATLEAEKIFNNHARLLKQAT